MDEEKEKEKPKGEKSEKKKLAVEEFKKLLKCPKCGSMQVYSLIDTTLVCRKCAFRGKV